MTAICPGGQGWQEGDEQDGQDGQRISELESEMDAENRRMADGQKNFRGIKELVYQQDEDKK